MLLFDAIEPLRPIILTGLPRANWAADQKVCWAAQYFPGTRIITMIARDKRPCEGGKVLLDDQERHRHIWEEVGGVFIHRRHAETSLAKLARYFPLPPS